MTEEVERNLDAQTITAVVLSHDVNEFPKIWYDDEGNVYDAMMLVLSAFIHRINPESLHMNVGSPIHNAFQYGLWHWPSWSNKARPH